MIKLTVNPHTRPSVYVFDKATVIIGALEGSNIDIRLAGEKLEQEHIRIVEVDNKFIAINQANDPFATINGMPFGKKVIHSNDIFEVGNTEILFEGNIVPGVKNLKIADTSVEIPAILDDVIAKKNKETPQSASSKISGDLGDITGSHFFETPQDEEFDLEEEMRELDSWLQETSLLDREKKNESGAVPPSEMIRTGIVNEIQNQTTQPDSVTTSSGQYDENLLKPEIISEDPRVPHKQTIKDLYFKDAEEETPFKEGQVPSKPSADQEPLKVDWHTVWIIVVGVVSTIVIIGLLLYANASGKSEDSELKAAEELSDIAMALAYAQLNNNIPHNQNWTDPEFLKSNLKAVLSAEYPPLAQIDSHGQFINSSYLLRIYTGSDLTNFLVIAQPAPSLLHWLIPKSTILVYSKHMELRKTTDLKSLNRVLINPTLDGSVASEVADIVKRGELISLSSISKRQHRLGFSPPKNLASIRPGAENLIYNAPRYYLFGEAIMKKAVALSNNQDDNHEIYALKNEINKLRRYPDFVMYSSLGVQGAERAQKALTLFDRDADFLIAYLQYNSQGTIQNTYLLSDSEEIALREFSSQTQTSRTYENAVQIGKGIEAHEKFSSSEIMHPLFFKLSALSAARQETLKPIHQKISELMKMEEEHPLPNFQRDFEDLVGRYVLVDNEQRAQMAKQITQLYREHASMPLAEFMNYVKSLGMEFIADASIKEQIKKNQNDSVDENTITFLIQNIKKAGDFIQLENDIGKAKNLLSAADIPDPDTIIAMQNTLKRETLRRVDAFILSSNDHLPSQSFTKENLLRLEKILKSVWIRDEEEINYYLNEFNLLMKNEVPEAPNKQRSFHDSYQEFDRFWRLIRSR